MASNLFARYVWLINTLLQHKRLSFEEINNLWIESGLSYGKGDDLPLRTFHNHRRAIKDIFDVYIDCDIKGGYKYYIDEPERLEDDNFRSWLISSYSVMNQVKGDQKLEKRIQFERMPSGNNFLQQIIESMRKNHKLEITYQGFGKDYANTFDVEPYHLKVHNRRWYLIGRSPYYNEIRIYGLDRIKSITIKEETFLIPKDFDIDEYFDGCSGIYSDKTIPIEYVKIKIYGAAQDYIKTLPIHSSQKELSSDDESTTFEYRVRPDFDFLQALLMQADQIEVIEPVSVRNEMRRFAENMLSYYKK